MSGLGHETFAFLGDREQPAWAQAVGSQDRLPGSRIGREIDTRLRGRLDRLLAGRVVQINIGNFARQPFSLHVADIGEDGGRKSLRRNAHHDAPIACPTAPMGYDLVTAILPKSDAETVIDLFPAVQLTWLVHQLESTLPTNTRHLEIKQPFAHILSGDE